MTLYINGEPIEEEPVKCEYMDYASGRSNSLMLLFMDETKEIRNKSIDKGDEIQAVAGNISTGVMYVSEIAYSGENISIRALSLPVSCYATQNKYWDHISFEEMVKDIAEETKLELVLENTIDVHYVDVTRIEMAPLNFLTKRLALEGFGARVYDGTLYVYDEQTKENEEPVEIYEEEDFEGYPEYSTSDAGLVAKVENRYLKADGTLIYTTVESETEGKILRENISVSSISESERFSKGIIREANKYEFIGSAVVDGLLRNVAENIFLADAPDGHDGQNYIYKVKSNLISETQTIYFRKPLEE